MCSLKSNSVSTRSKVRDRLRFLIGSGEGFRQIEIDLVPAPEHRVLFEEMAKARNCTRIPLNAEVVEAHAELGAAQTVTSFTPFHPDFFHQRAHGVAIEEGLKLFQRCLRFRLIALGCAHLREMRHRQLVLGVVGASVRRIEGEELAILVGCEHQRLGRLLAEVRVAHPELGIRPVRAVGVVVHDLAEVLACVRPFLILERRRPAVVQELVGVGDIGRDGVLVSTAGRHEQREQDQRTPQDCETVNQSSPQEPHSYCSRQVGSRQ